MANGGQRDGKQVVPISWIKDIVSNGDPQAWKDGDFYQVLGQRDMHYRSKWYIQREVKPMIFGIGIHGQFLFVDPDRKLSVAWFSSQNSALDSKHLEKTLATIEGIRELVS